MGLRPIDEFTKDGNFPGQKFNFQQNIRQNPPAVRWELRGLGGRRCAGGVRGGETYWAGGGGTGMGGGARKAIDVRMFNFAAV